jgi:hypothetical protein
MQQTNTDKKKLHEKKPIAFQLQARSTRVRKGDVCILFAKVLHIRNSPVPLLELRVIPITEFTV